MLRASPFRPSLFCAVLIAASCSDSSAPPPDPVLEVDAPAVISEIGDRLVVTARRGTLSTPIPELILVEEDRWLSDRPVFQVQSPTSLVARSAGRVKLAVKAFDATAYIEVRVVPAKPAIIGLAVDGDTVTLRGFAMNRLARDSIEGPMVTSILMQDSATLRFRFDATAPGAGCTPTIDMPLAVHGATAHTPLMVSGPHPDARALAVGEATSLPEGDLCLRLRAATNAEYILAWYDTRGLTRSRTRSLSGYQEEARPFFAQDMRAGGYGGRPAVFRKPALPQAASSDVIAAQSISAAPLAVGDTFTSPTHYWGTHHMTVVRIYDNQFVWALRTSDLPRLTPAIRAWADSSLTFIAGPVAAFYDSIYQSPRPTFNGQQYLVRTAIFRADSATGILGSAERNGFDTWFVADAAPDTNPEGLMSVMAHEYAHSRDLAYQYQTGYVGEGWALEGLATFLSAEAMRRRAGIAFSGNVEWADKPAFARMFGLFAEPHRFNGSIGSGYENTSPLLRDFTMRLIDHGLPYYAAVREVAQSVANGWYGCTTGSDCTKIGLAERMPQLLGAQWEATPAVLKFALSQAADDVVANTEFRNPTFLRYGASARAVGSGFIPWVFNGYRGLVTLGLLPHGVGYFVLEGPGDGAYRFWNTPPGMQWMVLRVR